MLRQLLKELSSVASSYFTWSSAMWSFHATLATIHNKKDNKDGNAT